MPPKEQLADEQIADLTKWIAEGAAWPAVEDADRVGKPNADYEKLRKEHWAWQPLRDAASSRPCDDAAWPRDDIDSFCWRRSKPSRLKPVGDADRLTLIRRVTFDLTGLPPTLDEIDAFLADAATGRVRAASSIGCWRRPHSANAGAGTGSTWPAMANRPARRATFPIPTPGAIAIMSSTRSMHDKPYDQFIREQIAGDLLPAALAAERDEQLVATGFLALGVKDVNQRFKVRFMMDNIDEQIDTVSRVGAGAHRELRPLPRSQVRSDPDDRLLRAGRHFS